VASVLAVLTIVPLESRNSMIMFGNGIALVSPSFTVPQSIPTPHVGGGGGGQAGPVFVQVVPQLSTPDVVVPQAGAAAEQLPLGTQAQAPPIFVQALPQLSTPLVVVAQAGTGALHDPLGIQIGHEAPLIEQVFPQLSVP